MPTLYSTSAAEALTTQLWPTLLVISTQAVVCPIQSTVLSLLWNHNHVILSLLSLFTCAHEHKPRCHQSVLCPAVHCFNCCNKIMQTLSVVSNLNCSNHQFASEWPNGNQPCNVTIKTNRHYLHNKVCLWTLTSMLLPIFNFAAD